MTHSYNNNGILIATSIYFKIRKSFVSNTLTTMLVKYYLKYFALTTISFDMCSIFFKSSYLASLAATSAYLFKEEDFLLNSFIVHFKMLTAD